MKHDFKRAPSTFLWRVPTPSLTHTRTPHAHTHTWKCPTHAETPGLNAMITRGEGGADCVEPVADEHGPLDPALHASRAYWAANRGCRLVEPFLRSGVDWPACAAAQRAQRTPKLNSTACFVCCCLAVHAPLVDLACSISPEKIAILRCVSAHSDRYFISVY